MLGNTFGSWSWGISCAGSVLVINWRSVTVAFLCVSRCSACCSKGVQCRRGAGQLGHFTLLLFHHEPPDPPQHHLDPDSFFWPRQSHTGITFWTLHVTVYHLNKKQISLIIPDYQPSQLCIIKMLFFTIHDIKETIKQSTIFQQHI